ncbi:hypothetical protein GGR54DRAFT_268189 [Hypoxylon sp. NC1633]|nr:hypothetical protein GGR54DRAFT_268189 [Hypoxylon sp. NC1633]
MAQPFGLVPAGQPLISTPTSQPSETSFLYAIPPHPTPSPSGSPPKPFAHLAVFLFPGVVLPPGTAAAIYVAQNPGALGQGDPNFRFLGGVGPGKESAVFKLSPSFASPSPAAAGATQGVVVIGISVEDASSVTEQMQRMQQQQQQHMSEHGGGAMVPAGGRQGQSVTRTQVLAQRIIQNAFNFLAGFSGKVGAEGIEVVPLRAFHDWWRKFENKVRNDPTFLEREQE